MYDFVDRPVASLDHGGRFLVWTMRAWVRSMHVSRCPCTSIGPAFAKWNMIAGLPHFHMMMMIFNRDALETFKFCAIECNRVSEHEALIISMINGMCFSKPDTVHATMALVVNEDSVTNLITAMSSLGRAMSNVGMSPGKPSVPASEDSYRYE